MKLFFFFVDCIVCNLSSIICKKKFEISGCTSQQPWLKHFIWVQFRLDLNFQKTKSLCNCKNFNGKKIGYRNESVFILIIEPKTYFILYDELPHFSIFRTVFPKTDHSAQNQALTLRVLSHDGKLMLTKLWSFKLVDIFVHLI